MDTIEDLLMHAEIQDGNNGDSYEVEGGWIDTEGKLHIMIVPK